MNDTFTDSDGDVWHRCEHPGVVEFAGRLWRIGPAGLVERACTETGEWRTSDLLNSARCAREAIAALWPETTRPESATPSIVAAPTPRRIIQLLSLGDGSVCAMCSDHTVWRCNDYHSWRQLPPIPQGDQ